MTSTKLYESWWVEILLRYTDDLPEDSPATIRIDCQNGYTWQGQLRDLRDVLGKALSTNSLKEAINQSRPAVVISETLYSEPPKWEYLTFRYAENLNYHQTFTQRGLEGWELVAVEKPHAFFKRSK